MTVVRITPVAHPSPGCATPALDSGEPRQHLSPSGAIIGPQSVQQAIDVEKRIAGQADVGAPPGTSPWIVLRGRCPLIVTAPHATEPWREGRYRFSDGAGTAALAVMLHRLGGVTALYTQYRTPSDPNFYDDNAFKATLAGLIETVEPVLVLDIHGSHESRPYEVDLGTMNGKSLLGCPSLVTDLTTLLHQAGIFNVSRNYFAAQKNRTITRFASARQVPTVQLEISSAFLRPSEGGMMAERFARVLQALTLYVQRIADRPPSKRSQPPEDASHHERH